ncbi:MAG: VWA domain-containing protein, partial [Candidatus Omnitrophica bacterium]|nr:VWA domain-containing protein [Candidatus Omnitrophota bacterium]
GIKAKGKAVILPTDGINNFGSVPPMVAAKAARALGIKIYTIGLVGEKGLVEAGDGSGRKVYKEGGIGIDERELKEIAKTTGGEYFRAENMDSLRASYAEIDKLEKAVIEEKDPNEYKDISRGFIITALLLLVLEIVLGGSILMKIP